MLYSRYWGKSDRTPGSIAWRPYVEHVAAVALCAEELFNLSPPFRKVLAGALGCTEDEARKLVLWAAVNHDLGKLHAAFQFKSPSGFDRAYPNPSKDQAYWVQEQKRGYWHGTGGYVWTKTCVKPPSWKNRLEFLLKAACAHHGSYASETDARVIETHQGCFGLLAANDKTREVTQDNFAIREFFEETSALCAIKGITPNPRDKDRVSLIVAGLISVADWLGSDEDFFPLRDSWEERSITEALADPALCGAARKSLGKAGFRSLPSKFNKPTPPGSGFSDLQEYCGDLTDARLVVIEAPTGDGKTEAALNLVHAYLEAGKADRLVFSLPTKATATAMWGRVKAFTKEVWGEDTQVQLAHGDAYRAMKRLKKNLGDRDASTFEYAWFKSGKRKLLSPVSVGTVDQVLVSALSGNRHHFVRSFALASAVTVIDEVHAVDVYMGSVLCELLKNIGAMGGRVVLLSATLSPSLRKILFEAFSEGMGIKNPFTGTMKGFPLVTSLHEDGQIKQKAEKSRRQDREVEVLPVQHDFDGLVWPSSQDERLLVQDLVSSVQAGATCCWIRNTVKQAQEAYADAVQMLPEQDVILLHAGLRPIDRGKVEARILEIFGPGEFAREGKSNPNRRPMLVIGTQILEQSLDIDFDRLVRDFAPADALVQALGRSHRHPWNVRPAGYGKPKLEVFTPRAFLGGQEDIYRLIYGGARLALAKTWDWLNRNAKIMEPSGVPGVIEEVFTPGSPDSRFKEDERAERRSNFYGSGVASANSIKFVGGAWGIDDGGDRSPTRLGESGRGFLFVLKTGTPGVLRISHSNVLLDLRPFGKLDLSKEPRKLRWDLQDQRGDWWKVVQNLPDYLCRRSGYSAGCDIRGYRSNSDSRRLEQLLAVDGREGDFSGTVVILLQDDAEQVVFQRVLDPLGRPYTSNHKVGYCPSHGMFSERI